MTSSSTGRLDKHVTPISGTVVAEYTGHILAGSTIEDPKMTCGLIFIPSKKLFLSIQIRYRSLFPHRTTHAISRVWAGYKSLCIMKHSAYSKARS